MGTIISGVIWVAIFAAVGVYGAKLGGMLGTVVSYAGWLLAVLSVMHVFKVLAYTAKGIKMMREDPEKFNKLRNEYYSAMDRLDEKERK